MGSDGDRLARTLAVLEDLQLRAGRAAQLLATLPSDEAVGLMAAIVDGAAKGLQDHQLALEGMLAALHREPNDPLRLDLAEAAREAGQPAVEALLSMKPPARAIDKGQPGYVDREMTARTLGHRKSIARGLNRDLLTRLAHDQDPAVVRNLLENPRLTEREALIAASRRPTSPHVLEEVYRSRRWSRSRRIRKALALNPYSPPSIAAAALSTLTAVELREVERDPHVKDEVREHARKLLAARKPGATAPDGD